MKSFAPRFLAGLRFSTEQLASIQALGEARGRQQLFVEQAPEQLAVLREAAVVESSESSNRIEGVIAPEGRVRAIVLKSSEPRDRSEQEIAGYRDALQMIHESHEHMPFNPNVVLQLHGVVFRYLASAGGLWKSADNAIVDVDAEGNVVRVRFKPTSPAATPGQMVSLAEGYARAVTTDRLEPLVAVPLAVLDFLCIHPFRDGNGRLARLLTLLLLYHHGYQVGRYISLERIIEESKQTYYETLEASSQGWHEGAHDPGPWLNYSWGALIRAYGEFEERVGTILSGRGSKTEQVRDAVRRRIGPFSVRDIERDCPGVSRDMVRHVLRSLRNLGEIEVRGRGRAARWHHKGS